MNPLKPLVKEIRSFSGKWEALSNFYQSPIIWRGHVWDTAEHAYQTAKTDDLVWQRKIRLARTPGVAKRLGRLCPMRETWDAEKLSVMEQILRQKFKNVVPAGVLGSTGNAILIEGNTWGDTYWGVCGGVGENHLGRLLMKIRPECQSLGLWDVSV